MILLSGLKEALVVERYFEQAEEGGNCTERRKEQREVFAISDCKDRWKLGQVQASRARAADLAFFCRVAMHTYCSGHIVRFQLVKRQNC